MLYGWKENSTLTNCLAECAHLAITVSQIERDIGRKSSFSHSPLAFDAPVKGVPNFPSEHRHPLWYGKTRMAWLPDGEKISKISLFVLAQLTNVTDRRTPGDGIYRAYTYASRGKNDNDSIIFTSYGIVIPWVDNIKFWVYSLCVLIYVS